MAKGKRGRARQNFIKRFFSVLGPGLITGAADDDPSGIATYSIARLGRNEGVRKLVTAERKAVVGSPDLESLTTSHIERAFLSVRQELKRFQRKGLGYSKDLEMHKLAVALHFGVYNFVRVHRTLGTTPAVAAGVEFERWSLERVVEMTADYMRRNEDAKFEEAFAKLGC